MHSLLETYLSEVAAHLSALPTKRRDEELREMRAHLESVFAAYRKQGQTEDEAARDAVMQFGTPEVVGQDTVTAWQRGQTLDRRSFWGAAACALVLSYLLSALVGQMEKTYILYAKPDLHSSAAWVGLFGLAYAAPVFVGGVSGILFPKRAVIGVGLATLVYSIFRSALVYHQFVGFVNLNAQFLHTVAICTGLDLAISALFTLFAAWVGSRWRKARTARAQMARS